MKPLLTLLFSIVPILLFGQFSETIRTGRPGQSIGAYTLGKNVFQVQSGILYNENVTGNSSTRSLVENTVLRLGILEKLELSSVINLQWDTFNANGTQINQNGISSMQLGGRYNILENKDAIPAIGIQGRVLLNTLSDPYKKEKLGSSFLLATGNKLTDWLTFISNWGITWKGNNDSPESLYIFNLSFGISEKFGGFAEMYGDLQNFSKNYDAGVYFVINNDLQLDFSGGLQQLETIDSNWFLDAGISWRIHWREDDKVTY